MVFVAVQAAGPISGGAFNPAVGTGLPLMSGVHDSMDDIWIYWFGPLMGAFLAAIFFNFTVRPSPLCLLPRYSTRAETGRRPSCAHSCCFSNLTRGVTSTHAGEGGLDAARQRAALWLRTAATIVVSYGCSSLLGEKPPLTSASHFNTRLPFPTLAGNLCRSCAPHRFAPTHFHAIYGLTPLPRVPS